MTPSPETPLAALVAIPATFIWLGMVLGISFIETPLKFRAPGITVPLGLGIGRLVFRALNSVEAVLALAIVVAGFSLGLSRATWALLVATIAILVVQVLVLRPLLDRRARMVIAGAFARRSRKHVGYVALELTKIVLLLVFGCSLVNMLTG